MQAGSLRYLWALFIRASFFYHSDQSEAQGRNLFILLTSVKLSPRPLFCHFDRSEAQWRSLFILQTSVKLFARPSFCHFDRSAAQWRNLLVLLSSVKLFARDETNTAARNLHVRQNRFRKIRAAAGPSLSSSAENISPSKRAQSRRRWETRADVRRQTASHN